MRHLAQARTPYSLRGLWIPGSRFARPGMTKEIRIERHRCSEWIGGLRWSLSSSRALRGPVGPTRPTCCSDV